ncbi:hypothetical protein QEN19_000212 [Hanseniaspora menglaensis]
MSETSIYKDKFNFFDFHGIVPFVNVKKIQLGLSYELQPIYGNNAIFSVKHFQKSGDLMLGPIFEALKQEQSKEGKIENTDDYSAKEQKEYEQFWEDIIYFCEYCFKYTNELKKFEKHCRTCEYQHRQPGKLVYLGENYVIKKISTEYHVIFLESLCLFTKFFLDNKSSFFNLKEFEFFIVYSKESDNESNERNKPLGFFSKQIASTHSENLSSILIIPPYRNKGLGTLLIEFSYKLSIHELEFSSRTHNSPNTDIFTTGPESPLSPFGLTMYIKYWQKSIVKEMIEYREQGLDTPLIQHLMKNTHFEPDHIIITMKHMKCVKLDTHNNSKYIDWDRVREINNKINTKNQKSEFDSKGLLIYY